MINQKEACSRRWQSNARKANVLPTADADRLKRANQPAGYVDGKKDQRRTGENASSKGSVVCGSATRVGRGGDIDD